MKNNPVFDVSIDPRDELGSELSFEKIMNDTYCGLEIDEDVKHGTDHAVIIICIIRYHHSGSAM